MIEQSKLLLKKCINQFFMIFFNSKWLESRRFIMPKKLKIKNCMRVMKNEKNNFTISSFIFRIRVHSICLLHILECM